MMFESATLNARLSLLVLSLIQWWCVKIDIFQSLHLFVGIWAYMHFRVPVAFYHADFSWDKNTHPSLSNYLIISKLQRCFFSARGKDALLLWIGAKRSCFWYSKRRSRNALLYIRIPQICWQIPEGNVNIIYEHLQSDNIITSHFIKYIFGKEIVHNSRAMYSLCQYSHH